MSKINFIINKRRILLLFFFILFILLFIFSGNKNNKNWNFKEPQEENIIEIKKELSILDSVYSYIFDLRLEHPRVVIAQCIEESGWFKGKIFKEANNCLGMKVPNNRPTLVKGVLYGHGKFDSWKDCLCDYAIWQSIYARGKTENEYFAYLDRVYAEKGGYSDRLKKIIKDNNF